MKLKIYRGAKEIGGTCIELKADNGKILWIDCGSPLASDNTDTTYINNPVDALLISHPHQDHYGLMEHLNPDTPVYMGQVTQDLINATRIFLRTPFISNNIQTIRPWEQISIADTFTITPYLVDHSSPEAFAFLIEVDNKRIFYSGDFRSTGRKNILHKKLLENPPKNIDLLLLEGTMINRDNSKYPSENDVEKAITDITRNQQNVSFVISSAQNIDRFCSVFRACKKTNKKLIVDIYNSWVLEMVGKVSKCLPQADTKEVKVYLSHGQLKSIEGNEFKSFRDKLERNSIGNDIFKNPSTYVYFLRNPNHKLVEKLKPKGEINLIYSMWEGYLKKEHSTYLSDNINQLRKDEGINFHAIHTSGHATTEDLITFTKAINPTLIVPMHTAYPEDFKNIFIKSGYDNIHVWQDNQEYTL